MNMIKDKYAITLFVTLIIFSSSIMQVSASTSNSTYVNPTPLSNSSFNYNELAFLKDVVGLDVDRYEVTQISSIKQDYTNNNNPVGNLGYIQTNEVYDLINWDTKTETYSDLRVFFSYVNSTLRSCSLSVNSGLAYSNRPIPLDLSAATSAFLERYNSFSADSELDTMKNMLASVDLTTNQSKINSNLKLEVNVENNLTSIRWVRTQNGVDYSHLVLEFKNGAFFDFFDSRSYLTIGSSEVNITQEQAIGLALKQADGFSYSYNGKLIENLTIVKDKIKAQLEANVRYNPSEYYLCWVIDLPLNTVYPGSIYYIQVKIWADDGQVLYSKAMGYGGPDPGISSITDQAQPTAKDDLSSENINKSQVETNPLTQEGIVAVIAFATLLSILTVTIVIKKRKGK